MRPLGQRTGVLLLAFAMFVNNVPLPGGVTLAREGRVLGQLCEIVHQHAP